MIYNEVKYIATNGEEYIADFLDRFTKKIKNSEDIFNLVMWDDANEAKSAIKWLIGEIDSKEEQKYFKKFYIKPIKIHIEL